MSLGDTVRFLGSTDSHSKQVALNIIVTEIHEIEGELKFKTQTYFFNVKQMCCQVI